ncbi:receptor expression-enhancing protein 3-B [Drosophila ficusphila]|uniref:receptor expression-enhancing protein 3-B n=1 Tax=Drosophila ficusphila TaxID=30025 RepID=UPI0007E7FE38|nr:receptor expression-enhancing protein 3-B [Drosophila ficusphila]
MLRLMYIYYGALCPGWSTLRAFSHGQSHFIELWLKYWVIYALLQGLGVLTDVLIGWLPFYAALKLILSVVLWFSAPYSTNHLFNLIGKYLLSKVEWIVDQGDHWHQALGKEVFRTLLQSPLVATVIPKDREDQGGGPQLNGDLLKRELSELMAEIEKDEASRCQQPRMSGRNLHRPQLASGEGLQSTNVDNFIGYLTQRLEDQHSEEDRPWHSLRRSKRMNPGHPK